jgi:hypothetical protein
MATQPNPAHARRVAALTSLQAIADHAPEEDRFWMYQAACSGMNAAEVLGLVSVMAEGLARGAAAGLAMSESNAA